MWSRSVVCLAAFILSFRIRAGGALGAPCPPIGYRVFFSPWMGNKGLTGSTLKTASSPRRKPVVVRTLTTTTPQDQLTLFYQVLPSCGRNHAKARARLYYDSTLHRLGCFGLRPLSRFIRGADRQC